MNNKFDELTKNMAQSVTRRGALKKFGLGLAGLALGASGLATKAHADVRRHPPHCQCKKPYNGCNPDDTYCILVCAGVCE